MALPRMTEIAHNHRQRRNHRRQLEHDRAVQAAALRGDTPPEWSQHDELDEGDMGDNFSIAGDTVHNHYHTAPQQAQQTQQSSVAPTLAKAALVAAGLLGAGGIGAGIPWLLGAYDKVNTTITETQNLGVGVDVVEGGASK